jgi:subtilisin family serine protease
LVLLVVTLAFTSTAWAGTIAPALETQMQSLGGEDEIKVLVVLRDQADITTLNRELHDAKVTRQHRHEVVLGALQDAAARSQGALLDDLSSRQRDGSIRGYTPHWLINAVVVVGTVDAIRELGQREDVEVIEPNLEVELIEPVVSDKPAPRGGQRGIGITPGVVAVGARRVWNELGIDGTGVVVGNMDTGVDGNHPALASRWRGLYAPASECWLDNSGQGNPSFPQDNHYISHGTHVMGTITGLAPDDTIGVAPGALWIATNTINQGVGSEFDNDVIESLEFFADPDGNPGTTDDVPCVVQNSWGTNGGLGYPDCFSYWWTAIDNCEAAGVCLTWSAGNEGPYASTMRSPADRADSPYNAFSVGSTQNYAPYNISDFSSRGPSTCGGPYAMKPEISAPGSNIYSAQAGGGYQYLDGTSMAGPHIAGVVALMCAANPDLDVETIKQVLMETAIDLGTPGEDNTYGHGFVDAYEAVLSVMGGLGTVTGTVTDYDTGLPLEGVRVSVVDRPTYRTTGADGTFEFMLPVGEWTLEFELFAYGDESVLVDVIENDTVDGSTTMTALPSATLSGLVYDHEGALVSGATIEVLGTPLAPVYSNGSGFYTIDMPAGAVYEVLARKAGHGAQQQTVNFTGSMTLDFTLPELIAEDFESGGFLSYPWVMGGNADWTIDTVDPYEGTYCAKSGDIGDSQDSEMEVTVEVAAAGDISFWYKVSSEATYDYLRFYIDGIEIAEWEGEEGWAEFSYPVSSGSHTFKWAFEKDYSVSSGSDCGWIDYIEFPTIGEPPAPDATLNPASIEETVAEGETGYATATLGNVGDADLTYLLGIEYGEPPAASYGGPDAYGYSWVDSNTPGGPVYNWVDISGIGTPITPGDIGPFALGFDFNYYGTLYNSIRIAPKGWLSFTSVSGSYSNLPVPDAMEPNTMLAPFWDDFNPNFGGTIYYYADSANSRFIAQWEQVWHFPSGPAETFQVIVNADGSILYQYKTVVSDGSCTIGIENADGTDGLQVIYDTAGYLHDGLAIEFAVDPGLAWLTVTPVSGAVSPLGSQTLDLTMDATNLAEGVYYADVLITTNDTENALMTLPVTLTVGPQTGVDDEIPVAAVFFGAVPNPFSPTTDLHFNLPAAADVELRIYDVAGRLVRTLVDGPRPGGENKVQWNGRDETGHDVASGTYFARFVVNEQASIKSVTLVR